MLVPTKSKYRKQMRGRLKGRARRGNTVTIGEFGMQAAEPHWLTNRQIEAARVVMNRVFKREGKIHLRSFPNKPVTKQPAETRMGKGKGNVEEWVTVVRPGRIIFEISGVSEEKAKRAVKKASYKLPIDVKFVKRENGGDVNES
ncbi:MAG: 50S ribosomal protein L16 [Fusobacteriota bacterium]